MFQNYLIETLKLVRSLIKFNKFYSIFANNYKFMIIEMGFGLLVMTSSDEELILDDPISYM